MDSINVLSETLKSSEVCGENPEKVDYNETNWNCATSKKFLACYFEHYKKEEEKKDDAIRSTPMNEKKFKCSLEEYQQCLPVLMENSSYEQICKCSKCLKFYHDHNAEFLFGIKNIEWLLPEMLQIIFKYILPSDRRVASECCEQFLDIWLCGIFLDDRRLVFDKCVLDADRKPLSTFLKSERTYRHLVFGNVIMREASVFAGKLWENVTTIELLKEFKSDDEDLNKKLSLLSKFPNLQTIEVAKIDLLGDFSNNVPTTIKLLVISGDENTSINIDQLNKIKLYVDKTCESFRVKLNFPISTENILNFTESQRHKIEKVHLTLKENDSTFKLPRFINLKYLKIDFDKRCHYGTEDILVDLEEQCPAIKKLSIQIHKRLPHKNWIFLKTLKAHDIPKEQWSRLSIFKNLKKLTLEPEYNSECFFVHKAFLNINLKKLALEFFSDDPCVNCFQTMTKSFPNLESFFCSFQITNVLLEDLAIHTPKLKCLELQCVHHSVSFACLPNLTELHIYDELEPHQFQTWPLMLHMRKLSLWLSNLHFETVKIFGRMPALEDLSVSPDHIIGDQLASFDALTKPLKRLQIIEFNSFGIQPEIYSKIIDVIANNCKYLRQINFNNYETDQPYASEEILKELLQKHQSIRCVDNVWLK